MRKMCTFLLAVATLFVATGSKGQTVYDPSVSVLGYDAVKSSHATTHISSVDTTPFVRAETGLTFNDGCFVQPDDSYTDFPPNDDGSLGPLSLPFTFTFYGTEYTSVYLNNNGNITFGSAYSSYSSTGFPMETAMIAPFWADVDTRGTGSNVVKYKIFPHKMIATWAGVGYYSYGVDRLDSFQVIISDGTDTSIGLGNNVAFRYCQMNWTTGDASEGSGGFGGIPATVGINAGDGINYIQIGRFGLDSYDYVDATSTSGVHWLEYNCFGLDVTSDSNIPPSVSGVPSGRVDTVHCGETKQYVLNWFPPEIGQTVSTTVSGDGACGISTIAPTGYFSVVRDTVNITGGSCNMGSHVIHVTGVDNIGAVTNDSFTVYVVPGGAATASGPVCEGTNLNLYATPSGGSYSWSGPGGFTSASQNPVITSASTSASGTYSVTVSFGECARTVTVDASVLSAGTISGPSTVCMGGNITLTQSVSGGSWSSSNTSVATIDGSGIVTSVSTGSAVISYMAPSGCVTTKNITVLALPSAISGASSICNGGTTTYTTSPGGGVWTSSNTSVATVSGVGVVSSVGSGSTIITYTAPNGCLVKKSLIVAAVPASVSVSGTMCSGSTQTASTTSTGGVWSSSNTGVATIDSASGLISTVTAGTTTISYSYSGGCSSTAVVTVNSTPMAISGSSSVCSGSTTVYTCATGGGVWSSDAPGVASVGVSGIVSGVSMGSATISYTMSSGCASTKMVYVSSLPSSITGGGSICQGGSLTLSSATSGGVWTSNSTSTASVDSSTGVVTGNYPGNATISYTLGGGCGVSTVVTVNSNPGTITSSSFTICEGASTVLSTSPSGGSWTSSNSSIATVSGGTVSGISGGVASITYTLPTGCMRSTNVTVTALPSTISGTLSVCTSSTTTLSSSPSGGVWTSGNTGRASVSAGVVTGITAGVVNISYTLTGGCRTISELTVNQSPAAISGGVTSMCAGATTTYTSSTTGGSWSSSNSGIASVDASGIVTGVSSGTATISYMMAGGCYKTKTITINAVPTTISGTLELCAGTTSTLSSTPTGGTWLSGSTSVASVTSPAGVLSGVSAGTSNITYTKSGCTTMTTVTVDGNPSTISGSSTVCPGSTTTLSSTTGGGTWSSSNSSIASVDASGVVTGVGAGTATMTYMLGTGCYAVKSITVSGSSSTLSGTGTVCEGSTTTLSSSAGSGTWSSSNTSVATVSGGVVAGITSGTATITFTAAGSCTSTTVVTVSAAPSAISGTTTMCVGTTVSLSSTTSGGTWSSSTPGVATVDASGVVTSLSNGTSSITYSLGSGCSTATTITVYSSPSAIGGTLVACTGSTTTLTNSTAGGTWSSSTPATGTINATTGVFGGISSGTSTVTYSMSTGCSSTAVVTVNANPDTIAGSMLVCVGLSNTLTNATSGGTWSSGTPGVASIVSGTGVVTGVSNGTSVISYTMGGGCRVTKTVTVNSSFNGSPASMTVCVGSSATLSDPEPGGTWSSSNVAKVTVNSSGVVTAIASGSANITYSLGGGSCIRKTLVTGASYSPVINGSATSCIGIPQVLSGYGGSVWSSSTPSVATINASTGSLTSLTAGTTTITCTYAGCTVTRVQTINPSPAAITGPSTVAVGNTITLSDVTPGGVWSSIYTAYATVNSSTGVVTGVSPSMYYPTIQYTLPTGCFVKKQIAVTATRTAPGADEVGTSAGFNLYPNPATGVFTIETSTGGTFVVSTVDGREVLRQEVTGTSTRIELPANAASGIYMCRFMGTDGSNRVVKLVYQQ